MISSAPLHANAFVPNNIKPAVKLQTSVTKEDIFCLSSTKDSEWILLFYIFNSSSFCFSLRYEIKHHSSHTGLQEDKARITNTLFKVKLLALVDQVADLLGWNFPGALFSINFESNYSSGFLFVAGSEILYSKASLSNTRKVSQLPCALQTEFSEKIELSVSCFSNVTL